MADTPSKLKPGGLTRGKAALIGILVIVLVGVLYMQRGSSDLVASSGPVASASRRRPSAPPVKQQPTSTTEKKVAGANTGTHVAIASVVDETHWKSPKLTEVVDYDPFALPATFPRPQAVGTTDSKGEGLVAAAAADDAQKLAAAMEQLQLQLEELKQRGVHVIIRERDQFVAMIGDRMIHVGDEIDGFTVTEIDPQGVRVERKVSQ